MTENKKNAFSIRDITLAATLLTLKFNIVSVDYQIEGERKTPIGYWGFEENEDLYNALRKYRDGELAVEPKAFMTNLKALKSETTNKFKNPHSEE